MEVMWGLIRVSTVTFLSRKRQNGKMTATVSKIQVQSVIVSLVSSICKKKLSRAGQLIVNNVSSQASRLKLLYIKIVNF